MFILLMGLPLESCFSYPKAIPSKQALNKTNHKFVEDTNQSQLVGKKFKIKKGGYKIKFYTEKEKESQNLQARISDKSGKIFFLPAYLNAIAIAQLVDLSKSGKVFTDLLQVVLPHSSKKGYVYIGGLKGGMKRKSEKISKQEEYKTIEPKQKKGKKSTNLVTQEESLSKNSENEEIPTSFSESFSGPIDISPLRIEEKQKGKVTIAKEKEREKGKEKEVENVTSNIIKTEYEYEDIDIQAILMARLRDTFGPSLTYQDTPIYVLAAVDNIMPNQLRKALKQNKKYHSYTDRILLIPCNLGMFHWVGILIEINSDEQPIRIQYMDSLKNSNKISATYQEQIQAIYPECDIHTSSLLKQDDPTSCGAYVIENLLLALQKAAALKRPSTEEIRKLHLESLRKNNFEFYKKFYNRQKNNTPTTTNLQAQLRYHKGVRFALAELKAIAKIKNCLLNITNKTVKDQLWKTFEQKKEYQDNPKLHLGAIRKELTWSEKELRKSAGEDDKKLFQDLIELLFNIRWEFGIPLLIDEASFCLDYEIILAITKIAVKAKDLAGFQRDIEDQIEDHELAIELQLQEELCKEASFKRMRQLKADQKGIKEEGFVQIQKESDVHQSEKEYKKAKKMMQKYNERQKGTKKYTPKTEKLFNKVIGKYRQAANKGHQKSQEKLKGLQQQTAYKGNPDKQAQRWIQKAVRKVLEKHSPALKQIEALIENNKLDRDQNKLIKATLEEVQNKTAHCLEDFYLSIKEIQKISKEALKWIQISLIQIIEYQPTNLEKFIKHVQDKKEYLHLSDLIVMDLHANRVPVIIEWGGIITERNNTNKSFCEDSEDSDYTPSEDKDSRALNLELMKEENVDRLDHQFLTLLEQKENIDMEDIQDIDFIFGPLFISGNKKYDDITMAVDPAGEGKDETTYCIAKRSGDYYFIVAVGGMGGGYIFENTDLPPTNEILDSTLLELVTVAKKYKVNNIHLEISGASTYEKVLKDALTKVEISHININTHYPPTHITKEERILNILSPIVNKHRLIIDKQVLKADCDSKETKNLYYKFFYQFMTMHRHRLTSHSYFDVGKSKHDDRIDVVAYAISYLQDRQDPKPRIYRKRELREQGIKLEKSLSSSKLKKLQGTANPLPIEQMDKDNSEATKAKPLIKEENIQAKIKLAIIYKKGLQGVRKNYKEARRLLEEALTEEPNNRKILKHLAEIYKCGFGIEEDLFKAYELYKRALRQKEKDPSILFELAGILKKISQTRSKTKPIVKFYNRAIAYLEQAADLGYPVAQYNLAKILFQNTESPNTDKAYELLYQAANSGYQKAQYKKADRYFTLVPNAPDRSLEIDWLQQAASIEKNSKSPKFGVAKAQLALGNWYYYHEEKFEEAFKYYLLASNMYTEAKEKLASMYYEGKGTEKDYNKSLEFYLQLFTEQEGKLIFYKDWFSQQNKKYKFYDSFITKEQKSKGGKIEYRIAKMYELRELHKLTISAITNEQVVKFYKAAIKKGNQKAQEALYKLRKKKKMK